MRVTIISGSFPPMVCGVGDYTARLSTVLADLGHEITVITSLGARTEIQDGNRFNLRLRPIVRQWSLSAVGMLLGEIRRSRPDVISIQYPASGYRRQPLVNALPLFLRAAGSMPYALTLHEFRSSHPLRKLSTLFLVWMADRLVVPDESERSTLGVFYPCSVVGKTETIFIGSNIDVSQRSDVGVENLEFLQSDAVISFFGLLTSKKDLGTLFKAFAQLIRSGYDLSLLMIGHVAFDSRAYLRLSQLAKELKITDNVSWTGQCSNEEVSWYLQRSDICVLPYADGVTLRRGSLIAALRHGLPVVTTWDESTVPSLLEDWHDICLVPIGDAEAMADAISLLLDDCDLRMELGSQARALGKQFDWRKIADRYESLFHSLR